MEREYNKKNLREIHRMIFEIAKGNFAYKIPRTNYRDLIEALSVQLNMMAEELRENLNHLSYVNPHRNYQHTPQASFILNASQIITGCTTNAFQLLAVKKEEIISKPFESLLSEESIPTWKEIKKAIQNNDFSNSFYQLEYVTGSNLLVPAKCFVSQIGGDKGVTNNYIITFFTTVIQKATRKAIPGNSQKNKLMSNWDIKAIQNIHDYISHNFTNPPLSNLELAHLFGINEHKLKYGFKILFGTSPFKYYNELRLKEAKVLIRNTNNSLEEISYILGFTSYPHFSKAFKAKFGYSPIKFKKKPEHNGDDK